MTDTAGTVAGWMRRAAGGMDVEARLKPLKPFPWLKTMLSTWEPRHRPKYYRLVCARA